MIDPRIFSSPLSLILAAAVLLSIFFFRHSRGAKFLTSGKTSVTLIVLAALAIAVEGTWAPGVFHHPAFLALVLLLMFSVGFVAAEDCKSKSYCALCSHLGLFLILFGGFFGAADTMDAQMRLFPDCGTHIAYNAKGEAIILPFSVSLDEFSIEYYEDGTSPKQYTSRLTIGGEKCETSVNRPCRHKGYRFYQSGYDTEYNEYSVLKVVRDPWMPATVIGVLLLAASILLRFKTIWNSWKVFASTIILAVAFTAASVANISFSTLMPALRSLWFIPHLIIYMLAYAILALAAITGIISLITAKIPSNLPSKLFSTSSSLLLAGMLCGAVWAQQAWGSYWAWDAKECWAAATWLLTLAGTHISRRRQKSRTLFIVLAFTAMQMTWYGVNYLPASGRSLHTYNQNKK